MSPHKIAKSVLFHARRARIRALAAPRGLPWLRRRLNLPTNEVFDPLAEPGDAAFRLVPFDAEDEFVRPLPDLQPPNAAARAFFVTHRHEAASKRFVAEFHGGLAWGHPTGGVFAADGRFVPTLAHDPGGAAHHAVWTRLRLPCPRELRGRTLYLVTPQATDNFHHWQIDLLPRLGLVQRAGYDLSAFDHVVINHSERPYQLDALATLGVAANKLIRPDESLLVRCEVLVVPSLKTPNQTIPAADVAFLRSRFLGEARPSTSARRRIFLSRRDAAFRRLHNEQQFYPALQAEGFEIVSLAGTTVFEQARLFAEAEVIAGPAGAAFANLVFASAGAHVIEITPPQWLSVYHWMISARLGLTHTMLLGDGPVMQGVPDSSARRHDIHLPRERLEHVLASLLPTVAP